MQNKGFVNITIILLLLVSLAAIFYFAQNFQLTPKTGTSSTANTVQEDRPVLTYQGTIDSKNYKFFLKYPNTLEQVLLYESGQYIYSLKFKTQPKDSVGIIRVSLVSEEYVQKRKTESTQGKDFYKKDEKTIGQYNVLRFITVHQGSIWIEHAIQHPNSNLYVSILSGDECSYCEWPIKLGEKSSEFARSYPYLAVVDQLIQTLEFGLIGSVEQIEQPDGVKVCGGIAPDLPENQCPEGYKCKLEGNYPDASGVCIKD